MSDLHSFYENDCPFCNFTTMVKTPVTTLLSDCGPEANRDPFDVVCFTPLKPVTWGHRLVVPTIHVPDVGWDAYITGVVMQAVAMVAHGPWDCNVITSKGAAATQTVGHFHVHVVPRFEGDGLALPWTNQEER